MARVGLVAPRRYLVQQQITQHRHGLIVLERASVPSEHQRRDRRAFPAILLSSPRTDILYSGSLPVDLRDIMLHDRGIRPNERLDHLEVLDPVDIHRAELVHLHGSHLVT